MKIIGAREHLIPDFLIAADHWVPSSIDTAWHILGLCVVPLGLLANRSDAGRSRYATRFAVRVGATFLGIALRLGVMPLVLLAFAFLAPIDCALRSVLIIQSAMPWAVFQIVLTQVHAGDLRMNAKPWAL